jgi:hypothetical protein
MEVSGHIYSPDALSPRKKPPVPTRWEGEWAPQVGLGVLEKRKNLLSPPRVEIGRLTPRPVTIPTELFRLTGDRHMKLLLCNKGNNNYSKSPVNDTVTGLYVIE